MIEQNGCAAADPVDEVARIAEWITALSTDHDDPTRIDLMRGVMKITSRRRPPKRKWPPHSLSPSARTNAQPASERSG